MKYLKKYNESNSNDIINYLHDLGMDLEDDLFSVGLMKLSKDETTINKELIAIEISHKCLFIINDIIDDLKRFNDYLNDEDYELNSFYVRILTPIIKQGNTFEEIKNIRNDLKFNKLTLFYSKKYNII